MTHQSNIEIFALCVASLASIASACASEPRTSEETLGNTARAGATALGNAGASVAGTGAAGSSTRMPSAGSGGVGVEGTAGSNAHAAGTMAGTGGTSAWEGDVAAKDAGSDSTISSENPCPPSFICTTDPLVMQVSACLMEGAVPLPVPCMIDADCVVAGLPKGLCLSEEETGLNGCLQLCTP
jgi:hypothetical protein